MVNLAGKKEFREVLEQHRQHLDEWCRTTRDALSFPLPIDVKERDIVPTKKPLIPSSTLEQRAL
jgi:hypothetical protein